MLEHATLRAVQQPQQKMGQNCSLGNHWIYCLTIINTFYQHFKRFIFVHTHRLSTTTPSLRFKLLIEGQSLGWLDTLEALRHGRALKG